MNTKKERLSECVQRLQEILASVDRLPSALCVECRPSLAHALAEATDLPALARWLESHRPPAIAATGVTADGCVLRHLELSIDAAGWPCVRPLDGPTVFPAVRANEILKCYLAARAAATAPVVLLEAVPLDTITEGSAMRLLPRDAAAVLRVLRANNSGP